MKMGLIPNISWKRRPAENLAVSLSEGELWQLFNMYISDDRALAEAYRASGSGNVGSRLDGYHRLLNFDTSHNQIGMAQMKRLIDVCWQMYDYDPLIKQGVDTRALYTFGQGLTVGCRKKGSWGNQLTKEINDFWFDPCNFKQLSSTTALMSLDVQSQLEGNVPLFFWKEGSDMWQARSLKTSWIEYLVMSNTKLPASKVVGYVLNMGNTANESGVLNTSGIVSSVIRDQRVVYADIDADPEELEGLVNGVPIDYSGRIAMLKSWGRPWSGLGVAPIIPALDPAQRYGSFLEDWSVVQGLFRTFALSVVSKGTNKGVQDVIKKYRENSASNAYNPALSSSDVDQKGEQPVAHTLFSGMSNAGQAGTRFEAIKTAGATEGPERARELKLMLCSAFGLPETMFGDAKVGNHATAHTLERTVDLRAQANQSLWADFIESILKFVARESRWGELQQESVDIFVRFPPIVEHVLNEHVEAITVAYKEGLITDFVATREILQALHVSDSEEVLAAMYPDNNDFGKVREPVDMLKTDSDVEKAKIAAQAMKDNAKMMASRSSGAAARSPNR